MIFSKTSYTLLLSLIFLCACEQKDELVEFKPLTFDTKGRGEYTDVKIDNADFYENLRKVLREYNVKFIDSNGILFIYKRDYDDKELIVNYSQKAIDTSWLNSR